MSSSANPIPSRPIVPHVQSTCSKAGCSTRLEFPVPEPHPSSGTRLYVRCWKCDSVIDHTFYPGQIPSSSSSATAQSSSSTSKPAPVKKGRKIGTQEKPLETAYYDILGVTVDATADEVKKAYRRLALLHHPDKTGNSPEATERFQQISLAYQTLSDPALRAKYNEYGAAGSTPEGGFVDPEEMFSSLFGGDRFIPIIGKSSLASDMKRALQEVEDEEEFSEVTTGPDGKPMKRILSEEQKKKKEDHERKRNDEKTKVRTARISELTETLALKLSIFTESATGPNDVEVKSSWRQICTLEAEDLSGESYAPALLQAIGFVYTSKSKAFLATNQTFLGVGGWFKNVQGKYHVFSETVSTLRSAMELKGVFDQIAAAEKNGNLSPEDKRKLEEQAAEKGLQALFKGTKLEIESVLRETCDIVLNDPTVSVEKQILRAVALDILGDAYTTVGTRVERQSGTNTPIGFPGTPSGGGGGGMGDDSEYVRIDKGSRR